MKGIIFNIIEEFIGENWGEEKYEEILGLCPLHTKEPFVGPGTYPDSDLISIVEKAAEILEISVPDVLRAAGKFMFPKLVEKFPQFIALHKHPKDFLVTIDSVIHVEVKKLYRDAETPRFQFTSPAPNKLAFDYQSKRKFCALVEGMLDGVAEHYKMPIQYHQTKCTHKGDTDCHFELQFGSRA
ncbi:MAG: heme NO-binding domain-containing protein [Deltaproteobacteria bacterium]|nr:heme NO-binding domain-containing protein [Deltaproteobacteria bacterium]